jgi:hypothetical protein
MGRCCCVLALLLACGGCSDFPPGAETVQDCVAQGRQLDPDSKQCADATPQAAKPSAKRHVRTAAAFQSHGIAVEHGAKIDAKLKGEAKLVGGLVSLVKARGYQCDTISAIKPLSSDNGFNLACNHFGQRYEIENRSGDWVVSAK